MKHVVIPILAFSLASTGALELAYAQDGGPAVLATFTNPATITPGEFGRALTAVGTNHVLIGAWLDNTGAMLAGAAHLFSLDGARVTTFTNPQPAFDDRFGSAVAALGSDRVLIGAQFDGAAYLFGTNGTLLNTFTNPNPNPAPGANDFGSSLSVLGSDRVLIGTTIASLGGEFRGAAYLFATNGTLLATFTNPITPGNAAFGFVVTPLGGDRVIVSTPFHNTPETNAGAAYIFSTNGALLTTLTNPSPSPNGYFGWSAVAVGNDRLLIGATGDNTGATNAGAAYLLDTNGTVLTKFTSPSPTNAGYFGRVVATTPTGLLLISAYFGGTVDAGATYLFSTNGTLLASFTTTPDVIDGFGRAVAAVGNDSVLIGAPASERALLFSLPYPRLGLTLGTTAVSVGWVADEAGLVLQQTGALDVPTAWSNTTNSVQTNGPTNIVQQLLPGDVTNRFFRLRRP